MEILDAKIFCDLVENQSFTLAAQKNFLTQSAVSQRINRMVEELTDSVFIDKKKVILSEKGKLIYRYLKDMLALYNQIKELADTGTNKQLLRIGFCESSKVQLYTPGLVSDLCSEGFLPEIYFGSSNDVYRKILLNDLDLGLVGNYPDPIGDLIVKTVLEEPIVLVTRRKNEIEKITSLESIPLIMDHPDSGLHRFLLSELTKNGLDLNRLNIHAYVGTPLDKISMLKDGFYFAFVPASFLQQHPFLSSLLTRDYSFTRKVYMIYRKINKHKVRLLDKLIHHTDYKSK